MDCQPTEKPLFHNEGRFFHGRRERSRKRPPRKNRRNIQNVAGTTARAENPPALVKKIGRTTYIVRIHFSETSTETMNDKIKRMLKNEIRQM